MTVMELTASAFGQAASQQVGRRLFVRGGESSGTTGRFRPFDQDWSMAAKPCAMNLETTSSGFSVVVRSFVSRGSTVHLADPLQVQGVVAGGDFELEVPELGILEFGSSQAECYANFMDALAFRWEEYALESDDRLSPRAKALAEAFRAMVVG